MIPPAVSAPRQSVAPSVPGTCGRCPHTAVAMDRQRQSPSGARPEGSHPYLYLVEKYRVPPPPPPSTPGHQNLSANMRKAEMEIVPAGTGDTSDVAERAQRERDRLRVLRWHSPMGLICILTRVGVHGFCVHGFRVHVQNRIHVHQNHHPAVRLAESSPPHPRCGSRGRTACSERAAASCRARRHVAAEGTSSSYVLGTAHSWARVSQGGEGGGKDHGADPLIWH